MFTLSKLVGLSLGILVIGSSGGIVVPAILGFSNILWEEGISKRSYKLEELEKTEQEISEKLTVSRVRYSTALKWLEYLKTFNYNQIFESFTKLFSTEESLEEKYKKVQEAIKELIGLIEKEGDAAIKKLATQKDINLLSTYSSALNSLSKGFDNWDTELEKIICAIDGQESVNNNCSKNFLSKMFKLVGLGGGSSGGSSSSSYSGGGGQGGEQAKQSLQEVKTELEKMSKSISEIIKETLKTKFKVSAMQISKWALMATLDVLLAGITAQKSTLTKNVSVISEEVNKLIAEISKLTGKIQGVNHNLESIKTKLKVLKNYEGMYLNSLCNLYTKQPTECSPSSISK